MVTAFEFPDVPHTPYTSAAKGLRFLEGIITKRVIIYDETKIVARLLIWHNFGGSVCERSKILQNRVLRKLQIDFLLLITCIFAFFVNQQVMLKISLSSRMCKSFSLVRLW